ncbi:peptidylprolyl isomerase [Chitinimonas sp. BJYL2]|uniref:peptidylprolyl isomerase n=1 Tax=Chitinimonas sp. BJYL2 TaxID=2976696 RepID=UPI0027E49ECE|nr:peptidylprolyl isomerase [Chitinimonas sp. BJYL2]
MKRLLLASLLVLMPLFATAANPVVRLSTNQGNIDIELLPEKAPKTVVNFLRYTKKKYYDGTVFHRVIPGFVAQGGGYTADLKWKPADKPIPNEAGNGLKNEPYTVAMAREAAPHTANSQFFINLANNSALDYRDENSNRGWGYAVFGRVVAGMDVVQKIAAIPTGRLNGMIDVPLQLVVVKKVAVMPNYVLPAPPVVPAETAPTPPVAPPEAPETPEAPVSQPQ